MDISVRSALAIDFVRTYAPLPHAMTATSCIVSKAPNAIAHLNRTETLDQSAFFTECNRNDITYLTDNLRCNVVKNDASPAEM